MHVQEIVLSRKILPCFRRININKLEQQRPISPLYSALKGIESSMEYKGSEKFKEFMNDQHIPPKNYFINGIAKPTTADSEIGQKLIDNLTRHNMRFDENVNKILGAKDILSFYDQDKKLVWFYGFKVPPALFDVSYLSNHKTSYSTRSYNDAINVFGRILQYIRNPKINIHALTLYQIFGLPGLDNRAVMEVVRSFYQNLPKVKVEYLQTYPDKIDDNEYSLIENILKPSIIGAGGRVDKNTEESGLSQTSGFDNNTLKKLMPLSKSNIPISTMSPEEIFKGMSKEQAKKFVDQLGALDTDNINKLGIGDKKFAFILKVLKDKYYIFSLKN